MNTSLQLTRSNVVTSQPADRPSLIARLIQIIIRLFRPCHDEPFALHYIANKYPGRID